MEHFVIRCELPCTLEGLCTIITPASYVYIMSDHAGFEISTKNGTKFSKEVINRVLVCTDCSGIRQ